MLESKHSVTLFRTPQLELIKVPSSAQSKSFLLRRSAFFQNKLNMKLLLVSIVLSLGAEINTMCPFRCQCFQSSRYVSCNNINSFPLPPVPNSLYNTVVISQSNLYFFDSFEKWASLKEVFFPQTWVNCENFEKITITSDISFTFGLNKCQIPGQKTTGRINTDEITTIPKGTTKEEINFSINLTTNLLLTSERYEFMTSTIFNPYENNTYETSTIFIENSGFNYWFILVFFNVFILFSVILASVVYILKYKTNMFRKVKRVPSALPTRSQLDIPFPSDFSCDVTFSQSDEIEMESFSSSYNNIYEVVASPYENIP